MKTTLLSCAGTGANRISCVKFSRMKRELHASTKHEIADSLAIVAGIAIAKSKSMKTITLNLLVALCLGAASLQAHAQGQVVDQESYPSPINTFAEGVDGLYLTDEPNEQFLQSFIPSLSAIDFVAMEFEYGTGSATVNVNLYEGSPNAYAATLVGATTAVTMPSGFNNDGLDVAGVQDFHFTTPITLTPGDTYYLEPTLVFGGAQWAFVTIIDYNTYPNGELYVNGSPFVNSTDIWFKEGVDVVPEPTSLPLIVVVCIFAYIFRDRLKRPTLPVLLFVGALFILPVLCVNASQDSVVQATADAAGLTPVSTTSPIGTFWVATVDSNGGLTTLPYPSLPTNMMDLPTYLVTNDIYIVDDTKGELSSSSTEQVMSSADASSVGQEQSQTVASLIDMIDNHPVPSTNGDTGDAVG